jgi:hypothetical protein
MKIYKAEKGDFYEQVEMDIRAILKGLPGRKLLDRDNCFLEDTQISFTKKKRLKYDRTYI